ncbi:hypothetical protein [Psychrobacter sp. FDAARGOS_221]|uniref:hypothetical protein n=1 Tax=Psychrobacter sp. FDAARGOS_221 TaxID=1975705 RepID=UPI000BB548C0|nr:hypothetical protein [Psychrobacter sp. FDAARGOS_221]PNK59534.1 hypothetical protein A6J60_000625 [Psychrobacter sp. FDAARGOS_221]
MSPMDSQQNSLSREKSTFKNASAQKVSVDNNSIENASAESNHKLLVSSEPHHNQLPIISAVRPLSELNHTVAIGYIVELGSNENANPHLAQARNQLSSLCDQRIWSTAFVNPDYTATIDNPKPDYTNQCGLLVMSEGHQDVLGLIAATKDIERHIKQGFFDSQPSTSIQTSTSRTKSFDSAASTTTNVKPANRQVLIDIDVLALVTANGVIAINERYPFKNHEWVGINELYTKGCFSHI